MKDSWLKNIRNARGTLTYADGRVYGVIPPRVFQRVERAMAQKPEVLRRVFSQIPSAEGAPGLKGPELEVSPHPRLPGWRLLWVVEYLDRDEDVFRRVYADLKGRILWSRTVGSDYVDAPATVFPRGPRASQLSQVVLKELSGDGSLSGKKTKVISSDDLSLLKWDASNLFHFSTDDHRFDAVQAYFYVDQALDWFRAQAGFDLPFGLTLDVFAGGVEKPRNTACYYYGIIRLGTGDGRTYQGLMRDPSVVMHEVAHAVIETIAHLPTDGEGGSINEAFADFFAANILGNPKMGEASYLVGPHRRNLEASLSIASKNGGLYHDSLAVSGALWEIRRNLGPTQGTNFAMKLLARLNADSTFSSLKSAAQLALVEGFSELEVKSVLRILDGRGWMNTP